MLVCGSCEFALTIPFATEADPLITPLKLLSRHPQKCHLDTSKSNKLSYTSQCNPYADHTPAVSMPPRKL